MSLLARFDWLLSELRLLMEEAAGHAEIVDKLENYLSEKRLFGAASKRARRSRDPVLSPEKKEAIKAKLLSVLARERDGMKISALAERAGIEGFRLRLILGELRAEKKVRLEGDKGGARYVASSPAPAGEVKKSVASKAKARRPKRAKAASKAKTTKTANTAKTTSTTKTTNTTNTTKTTTTAARPKATRAPIPTKPARRAPVPRKTGVGARSSAAPTTKVAASSTRPAAPPPSGADSTATPPSGSAS